MSSAGLAVIRNAGIIQKSPIWVFKVLKLIKAEGSMSKEGNIMYMPPSH